MEYPMSSYSTSPTHLMQTFLPQAKSKSKRKKSAGNQQHPPHMHPALGHPQQRPQTHIPVKDCGPISPHEQPQKVALPPQKPKSRKKKASKANLAHEGGLHEMPPSYETACLSQASLQAALEAEKKRLVPQGSYEGMGEVPGAEWMGHMPPCHGQPMTVHQRSPPTSMASPTGVPTSSPLTQPTPTSPPTHAPHHQMGPRPATCSPASQTLSPLSEGGSHYPRGHSFPTSPTHLQAMQQLQHQRTQTSPPGGMTHPQMVPAYPAHPYPTPPSQHSHRADGTPQHGHSTEHYGEPYLTPSPDSPGQWSSSSPHSAHSDWSEGISSPQPLTSRPLMQQATHPPMTTKMADGIYLWKPETYWWLSVRGQYLWCDSTRDSSALH